MRVLPILLLLLLQTVVHGQVMEGIVTNAETSLGIQGVLVHNSRSGASVLTNTNGDYSIVALGGDTITFQHPSYYEMSEMMLYSVTKLRRSVAMPPLVHKLKEATIIGLSKFQRDSIELHEQFGHELNRQDIPKPKYLGLGCAGCIGWLVDKITGNSKKLKKFKGGFASEEEERFISTRYTPELVRAQTGMHDTDSISNFMYNCPMEYAFARAATDLEIKAWIRSTYKEYKLRRRDLIR